MSKDRTIALVGVPNSGKTTLFNWLTGARFEAVNYGGSTVTCHRGLSQLRWGEPQLELLDTPGTYSLIPKSPEEEVTFQVLFTDRESVEAVVLVLDSTQLSRQVHLVDQLKELKRPIVIALTMTDLLVDEGLKIDLDKMQNELEVPVVEVDGRLGGGIELLLKKVRLILGATDASATHSFKASPELSLTDKRLRPEFNIENYASSARIVEGWLSRVSVLSKSSAFKRTKKIDQIALHPVAGSFIFLGIMSLLFSSVFWAAEPLMNQIDVFFAYLSQATKTLGSGLWVDFLTDGLLLSVSAVLVFVPQIFILFFGLALLEQSGYLARTATLVDGLFLRLGLSGRSFVPFLSGFACAVPAILSVRGLRSVKERWITVFVLPLMSCSARLPIYVLLLSFLFLGQSSWKPGLMLAFIYVGSLLLGGAAAAFLNRFVQLPDDSLFALDLPVYRKPYLKMCGYKAYKRTKSFVVDAGPMIFTFALIIWGLSSFPRIDSVQDGASSAPSLDESFLGQGGKYLEPIFAPMGADWRTGVGILASFAAREIFVSSLAIVMNVGETDQENEENMRASLLRQMLEARKPSGEMAFSVPSVTALIVFFMIALQCLSTVAMAAKEMKSYRFAAVQWISLTLVAYLAAVLTFQVLSMA